MISNIPWYDALLLLVGAGVILYAIAYVIVSNNRHTMRGPKVSGKPTLEGRR